MQEHPEDHEKIEKLKDLIAWQVKVAGTGWVRDKVKGIIPWHAYQQGHADIQPPPPQPCVGCTQDSSQRLTFLSL